MRNDSRPSRLVGTCYVENQTWKQSGHEGKEQVKFLFFYQSMLCLSTAFYPACNQSFSVKIFSHVMKKNYSALSFWSFPASVPPTFQLTRHIRIFSFSPLQRLEPDKSLLVARVDCISVRFRFYDFLSPKTYPPPPTRER